MAETPPKDGLLKKAAAEITHREMNALTRIQGTGSVDSAAQAIDAYSRGEFKEGIGFAMDANKKAAAHMLDGAKDAAKGVKGFVSENSESLAGIGGIYGEIARRAFSSHVSGGEHSISNAPPLLTPTNNAGTNTVKAKPTR